ncbi:ABC transporter ATP-binding protein [Poseidonocella sp. HB161398]|uniref:ABC transporter ATP-binding protein n=1 Tax=Poseidonocella sp. HB161398 TaxID=2320855 RepID=UPI001107B0BE|nr:ABC transporter ATP-binding protein [Poseidonocella sp. HB161398]
MTSSTRASASAEALPAPLLAVTSLALDADPSSPLIEDLSFTLDRGETLAIVGESGCGKSLTSLAVMQLLPTNLARSARGKIRLDGEDLTRMKPRQLQRLRGDRMAMIFQEPLTALNPVMSVGAQIAEVLRDHRGLSRAVALSRAETLLGMVGIPDPGARLGDHPHQLSGGMRQRVTIAMAMACEPDLIIADEPTTALDVTVQAQILRLLADLQARSGMAMIMITHDLGVVRQVADRMVVMYAGTMVEEGRVADVLTRPHHPYTAGLIAARPSGAFKQDGRKLNDIPGMVPAPSARPAGCLFQPRCAQARPDCAAARPEVAEDAGGTAPRRWRCFHPLNRPEPGEES